MIIRGVLRTFRRLGRPDACFSTPNNNSIDQVSPLGLDGSRLSSDQADNNPKQVANLVNRSVMGDKTWVLQNLNRDIVKQDLPLFLRIVDRLNRKPPIDQQIESRLKQVLGSARVDKSHSHLVLDLVLNKGLGAKLQYLYLNRYLLHCQNSGQQIDVALLSRCSVESIAGLKKRIIRLSLSQQESVLGVFGFLARLKVLTDDELRTFDDYFAKQPLPLTLEDQIQILQVFGRQGKKGLFVELFTASLEKTGPQLDNRQLLSVLMALHDLKELEAIRALQSTIVNRILNAKLNQKETRLVIQILHQNGLGGLQFWELQEIMSRTGQPNEVFAVLAGLFRNNSYNPQLLVRLIQLDNRLEMLPAGLTSDQFLEVMIVYYASYLHLSEQLKPVLSKLILNKLEANYPHIKYKDTSNFFTWLFTPETDVEAKKLSYKLCHFPPNEKSLLALKFQVQYQCMSDDMSYMMSEYVELNELSIIQEILIRRRRRYKQPVQF